MTYRLALWPLRGRGAFRYPHPQGPWPQWWWIPLQAAVEWRWGVESPTTPWYPLARLFRQHRVGEWAPVFDHLAAELQELVARRRVEAA